MDWIQIQLKMNFSKNILKELTQTRLNVLGGAEHYPESYTRLGYYCVVMGLIRFLGNGGILRFQR